jgi:predicted Zn-dependent protease
MRLSPYDPHKFNMQAVVAYGYILLRRFDEAASWAEKAVRERSTHITSWRVLAASYALCGRMEQATKAVAQLRELDPALRLSNLKDVIPIQPKEMMELFADALRLAGLPE